MINIPYQIVFVLSCKEMLVNKTLHSTTNLFSHTNKFILQLQRTISTQLPNTISFKVAFFSNAKLNNLLKCSFKTSSSRHGSFYNKVLLTFPIIIVSLSINHLPPLISHLIILKVSLLQIKSLTLTHHIYELKFDTKPIILSP